MDPARDPKPPVAPDSFSDGADSHKRRDQRGLRISIWLGVALGLLLGIPRYGLFSMSTVTIVGLLLIVSVSVYAAVIALLPARPVDVPSVRP